MTGITGDSMIPPVSDAPASAHGVYLYCVGRSDALVELGPVGLGGAHVRLVRHNGLAGLVSDVPAGAHVDAGLPSRASLFAHEFVTSAAMRRRTVVPAAYGMVFRSDADVVAVLEVARDAIDGALASLADRVQMELKLVWSAGSPAADGDARVEEMYDALREVSAANRTRTPIGERMLRNVSFLVDRAQLAAFAERLDVLRARHQAQLEYRVSAPSAPCDFVRVRLRVERPDELGNARARA